MNDKCMQEFMSYVFAMSAKFTENESLAIRKLSTVFCKTHLKIIVLRHVLFHKHTRSILINSCGSGNKGVYQLFQTAQNDNFSCDISTCKLLCAICLYMKGDYVPTLDIVNKVLSNIPPYILYEGSVSNEGDQIYVDKFLDSNITVMQKAKTAWIFDLHFLKDMLPTEIPTGIKIELHFCNRAVSLSPFICAYYLQFLCYNEMRQYARRENALQHLTEVANNHAQSGLPMTSMNIAGHCLLVAGKIDQARGMFYRSHELSQIFISRDMFTSALWYLQNYC